MTAQKFQLRYSPVEDRILIIVTDESGEDEVFGLTRRLVKRLVPSVEHVLKKAGHLVQPQVPETQDPAPAPTPAETLAMEGQRKAATEDGPPAKTLPATESEPAPMAPAPSHLVTRLRVTDRGKGMHMLYMTDGRTETNIPLNNEQLAQFSHGIVTILGNADWDLAAVDTGTVETGTPADPIDITAESPSKYRH